MHFQVDVSPFSFLFLLQKSFMTWRQENLLSQTLLFKTPWWHLPVGYHSLLGQTANVSLYHVTKCSLVNRLLFIISLTTRKSVDLRQINNNCFKLFLSAHFSFWKFLNLNLTFAVCCKSDAYIFSLITVTDLEWNFICYKKWENSLIALHAVIKESHQITFNLVIQMVCAYQQGQRKRRLK